VGNVWGHS
jgi:hypothetical protein